MTQTWHDLLFAHWPIAAAELAPKIAPPFELDLFDGVAWLGIVPFQLTNVSPRGMPSIPGVSAFAETNVRTYVRVADRPGVYFFSLDADSAIAVKAARTLFNLPYFKAHMSVTTSGDQITYWCVRTTDDDSEPPRFDAVYEPAGPSFAAEPLTLEHFLTERYCLYHHDHTGAPYRLDIHHPPWPLQVASAEVRRRTLAAANGVEVAGKPSLLHFSKRQDMIAWLPSPIGE